MSVFRISGLARHQFVGRMMESPLRAMKPGLQQLAVLIVLFSGCATREPTISSTPGTLPLTNGLHLQFRAAALVGDTTPAEYSFQKAKGKLGSTKEGLSDAAEIAVGGPALGVIVPGVIICETIHAAQDQSQVLFGTAVAGAAGVIAVAGAGVVAPAVAAKGLIRSWKKVSPQELAEREADLQNALKLTASQERFHHCLLASAEQNLPGRLVAASLDGKAEEATSKVDAMLEARIEELRLERKGSDEGSYFLRIKARARLISKAGNGLMYEQSVEYRSGRSLFLDWTYHEALENVAQTGYRALADYFVGLIFQAP